MKTINKTLIPISLVFLCLSCTKEKVADNNQNKLSLEAVIVGSWDQTLMEEKDGIMTSGGMTFGTYSGKALNDNSTWVFSENPREVLFNFSYELSRIYNSGSEPNNHTITIYKSDNMNYSVNGNDKITLNNISTGEMMEYDVISFSENKIELSGYSETTTSGGSSAPSTLSHNVIITLEK